MKSTKLIVKIILLFLCVSTFQSIGIRKRAGKIARSGEGEPIYCPYGTSDQNKVDALCDAACKSTLTNYLSKGWKLKENSKPSNQCSENATLFSALEKNVCAIRFRVDLGIARGDNGLRTEYCKK